MSKSLFITATGTDVGKTYVSGLIAKKLKDDGYNIGYYKAALSGSNDIKDSDAWYVKQKADLEDEYNEMVSYTYKNAYSPHLAAQIERYDNDKKIFLEDIIKELDLPCLIVADAGLGTINSAVLTIEYMRSKNLKINGVILNRFEIGNVMHEDNKKMIEEITGVNIVGIVVSNALNKENEFHVDNLSFLFE